MAHSSMGVPDTILILGSGVFGLSTAHALSNRPSYKRSRITLLSPTFPSTNTDHTARDQTASIDNTRIIRADYADPLYSRLAREAQIQWRGEWGAEGRYSESGLVITADEGGEAYVRKAMANVKASEHDGDLDRAVTELSSPAEIAEAMKSRDGAAVASGSSGYVNPHSGWADAGAAMRWLQRQVAADGRVEFRVGEAKKLLHSQTPEAGGSRVTGVELADGNVIHADLTILATGAWTPRLLDLRGIASARGQCMEYISLSQKEGEALSDIPVHLNMAQGCFFFPPLKNDGDDYEIKVARHAYGYTNPATCKEPLSNDPLSADKAIPQDGITASLPTFPNDIPTRDRKLLSDFLGASLPILNFSDDSNDRQTRSRMCWYLDTPTSDFLVCYHPAYSTSLFLATGGSGHAYKFLPVLGAKIVDVLEGKDDKEGMMWAEKWRWRGRLQDDDEVWCEDGSRSGSKGEVWEPNSKTG